MSSSQETLFKGSDGSNGARFLLKTGYEGSICYAAREDTANQQEPCVPVEEIELDDRWLIDAKCLLVGPKIGEGSYSKVYEGKYHDQDVAIKIIQPGDTPMEVLKRQSRFARETTLLQRVQHKNLVKFVGACKNPAMVVVTELLRGGSLRKYLINLRPARLELGVAVTYALDIARAMDFLHSYGLIHRDLKPDNLLLTGDLKSLKLADFGLAREMTLTEMMTAETGTYRWMAPELYSTVTLRDGAKKHYDQKVDIYSFSIVLWELLTNRMPFEGMSNLQAAYAAAFKGTRPSLSWEHNLPEGLVYIMQSCWAEDPQMRPTFAQVVRMLSSFLGTIPSTMPPKSPSFLVSKSVPVARKLSNKNTSKDKDSDVNGASNLSSKSRRSLSFLLGHCLFARMGERLMQ